ncbi:MAG TPA: hypothetical protein PKC87_06590, partial [Candidatus Absconditabacterales bacterium]|nr:hypothetical protein [Candidatus Absconditabacterales bacterium]
MTKSIVSHLPVTKHIKKIGTHVKKHHKKYLWSAVGLFGLFKLFAFLLMGISGYMVTHATVPPIPTMATEPPYTTGTTNNVGIFGGLGASNIEYLFCKLTTNNVSGCILSQSVSQRSSTPNTTFTGLTNGQIYYYF